MTLVVVSVLMLLQVVNSQLVYKSHSKIGLVDLSRDVHEGIPKYPIYNAMSRNVAEFRLEGLVKVKTEVICMPTHYGTHMDAPCHVNGTWCLDDVPLERLVHLPAAVIDVRQGIFDGEKVINADYGVTVEDLLNWEKINGEIPEDGLILFFTGWGRFWNDSEKYVGGTNVNNAVSPGLSKEAAQWIVKHRPTVVGVGIDTVNLDRGKSTTLESHAVLHTAHVYILENLTNLDKVPTTGARVSVGVLKLSRKASGAPARVYASFNA